MGTTDNADEHESLPGEPRSLWLDTTPETDFDPLSGDLRVDAAVVGGGIAGITTATHLQEAGLDVAVLEADRVLEAVTGHTTAKVTSQHGLIYDHVRSAFDVETARAYAAANEAAIEDIADRIEDRGIDCDFRRQSAYTYVTSRENRRAVREEVSAARQAGIDAAFVEETPLPYDVECAVRFDDQAQFHPRKYLLDLVEAIPVDGSGVYEETRVTDVESGDPCRVETERGTVYADSVVVATHFPVFDHGFYFAREYPKRSYVLAARLNETPPDGMHYRDEEPYFSVRTQPGDGGEFVFIGGQNHKTGQGGSTAKRYRKLAEEARERFDVASIEYRWSTQDYRTADRIPFVGRLGPSTDDVYVATGFGGWGMTGGTVAGMILSDLIAGEPNPWADVYSPTRVELRSTGAEMLKENAEVAREFVGDWATKPLTSVVTLSPGDATVTREGGSVVGTYRDADGKEYKVSAVCPHMGCLLEWNDGEKSWDCPCHGSRFTYEGEVLDGPANADLSRLDLDD
ncbi:FAD-dependent oxidoreductase [Halostella sp. JP-L12]|uniref:FAD-dependent oxidoreductase n=1 Tax=Halostella TaxID=1843185 RepID=UPI000EF79619|nr:MULTISPECIES: FAD-dependent oxidoreductase [Halostella]NHN47430.1 FAD-dependent oxidoreductase [Halostella sp. JP-L12]